MSNWPHRFDSLPEALQRPLGSKRPAAQAPSLRWPDAPMTSSPRVPRPPEAPRPQLAVGCSRAARRPAADSCGYHCRSRVAAGRRPCPLLDTRCVQSCQPVARKARRWDCNMPSPKHLAPACNDEGTGLLSPRSVAFPQNLLLATIHRLFSCVVWVTNLGLLGYGWRSQQPSHPDAWPADLQQHRHRRAAGGQHHHGPGLRPLRARVWAVSPMLVARSRRSPLSVAVSDSGMT